MQVLFRPTVMIWWVQRVRFLERTICVPPVFVSWEWLVA